MTFHEDMKYWVWLQRAAGKGANLERLLSPFGGDVRALYEADPGERERLLRETPSESADWQREEARGAGMRGGWMRDGWRADGQEVLPGWQKGKSAARKKRPVAESTLQRMKKVSLVEAEETLELCERTGVVPICPADDRYPWLLREVPTCPAVLYALGDLRLLTPTTLPFAMVGARDARLSSLSAASDLAGSLARAGFLIVSGGAIGTDSACHIGALNAGCPTVAVLGTGIGTNYLQQNADLRRVISHNGLLLSEMEPGEPGSRGSFPLRNRIIAGMSVGTLVVEAAVKSGSLITSKYAEEYDRDVFVPLFPGIDPERELADDYPTYAAEPSALSELEASTDLKAPELARRRSNTTHARQASVPTKLSSAFRGTRELLERETGVGIRCAADVLAAYADSYGLRRGPDPGRHRPRRRLPAAAVPLHGREGPRPARPAPRRSRLRLRLCFCRLGCARRHVARHRRPRAPRRCALGPGWFGHLEPEPRLGSVPHRRGCRTPNLHLRGVRLPPRRPPARGCAARRRFSSVWRQT